MKHKAIQDEPIQDEVKHSHAVPPAARFVYAMGWKHRWIHAADPYLAFEIWLEARWPHATEGEWLLRAVKTYDQDEEVPRDMVADRPSMPQDPF
jgi:hypothetical protein